jgi:type IV secretory pathway VirD2 relaxase
MAVDDLWELARRVSGARGLTAEHKQRLSRIVRKTPEVMVKVTGRSVGPGHLKAHLDYVTRNGTLRAIGGDGRVVETRPELRGLHDEWVLKNELTTRRHDDKAASAVHIMLSMPPKTNGDAVERAASAWAANVLGDRYDYIVTRHDDQDHPHVHVTVRAVGTDGRRLRVDRADLQQWREHFATKLRERGIEAEATPRKARGQHRRADRHEVRQLKERGILPRVETEAMREVVRETRAERKPEAKPWEERIERRRENVLAAYAAHAAELDGGTDADRQLARDIRRFVDDMPVARTRRQDLRAELEAVLAQRRAAEAAREAPPIPEPTRHPTKILRLDEPER